MAGMKEGRDGWRDGGREEGWEWKAGGGTAQA